MSLALLLRLWIWLFAADWTSVATYTSFLYVGPFTVLLVWAICRGHHWARWIWVILYVARVMSWTRAMVVTGYSTGDVAVISVLLILQAVGTLLLFLPASNIWFRAGGTSANNVPEVTAG